MAKIPQYPDEAAFPRDAVKHIGMNEAREISLPTQWGLTKREYFAAQIAAGICSTPTWPAKTDGPYIAELAVTIADALLAQLAVG